MPTVRGPLHTLGYYDPKQEVTKDSNYRVLACGNVLSSLIFDEC